MNAKPPRNAAVKNKNHLLRQRLWLKVKHVSYQCLMPSGRSAASLLDFAVNLKSIVDP